MAAQRTIRTRRAVFGSSSDSAGFKLITASALPGCFDNSSRNRKRSKNNVANHATATIGREWIRKSLNEKPAAEPINTFGGSPTKVATPPVFESRASAI